MELSIIIVNHNTRNLLRNCLKSVYFCRSRYQFDVWVVDNASFDGSGEMVRKDFPQVNLITNGENMGYTKANNMVLKKNASRFVLLLNPDVVVSPDTLDKVIDYMEGNSLIGIAGCKVVKPDGKLDLACRRSFPNPVNSFFRLSGLSFLFPKSRLASYNLTYLPEDEIAEVDSVMGAFLMIRREVIEKIGLLDEDFFMYGEDLDWCYRAKAAGYKVVYAPITSVVHHKGSASRQSSQKALLEFHRAMQIFYNKYYRQQYGFIASLFVYFGIWLRYLAKSVQNLFRRDKVVSK